MQNEKTKMQMMRVVSFITTMRKTMIKMIKMIEVSFSTLQAKERILKKTMMVKYRIPLLP